MASKKRSSLKCIIKNRIMVHIICLTKSYNYLDFKDWFKWYIKLGCFIHIIDNDSSIPIFDFVSKYLNLGMPYYNDVNLNVTYDKIEGWPNQYKDRKSTRLNSSHQIISYAV